MSPQLFPNNTSLVTIADHLKRMKRLPDSLRISFWDEANEPRSRGYVRVSSRDGPMAEEILKKTINSVIAMIFAPHDCLWGKTVGFAVL